jgi:hypothetical protein
LLCSSWCSLLRFCSVWAQPWALQPEANTATQDSKCPNGRKDAFAICTTQYACNHKEQCNSTNAYMLPCSVSACATKLPQGFCTQEGLAQRLTTICPSQP